ncbi:MAG: hypothetical protein KAW12_27055 [Candidatus Aminicenantes bacterium]|nr:hypothetical protein [Candidatus Aminicenantes bacterium]
MQADSKLFLETTIQIDRCSSDIDKKEKIDQVISRFSEISSSTYVKMEFKRRFIQDLVYLYHILIGSENFKDVWFRISKLRSDYHKRKINGIIASFCGFFADHENEEVHGPLGSELLEKAVRYFRNIIEVAWESFNREVSEVLDETGCYNAKIGPTRKGEKFDNRTKKCKKEDIKCKIVEFFTRNRKSFKKIYKKLCQLDCLDDEQEKLKNILENALKKPRIMADRKNCWNCGDAIIAAESPGDAVLFTTNIKHFEPICSEIKKKCTSS